MNQALENEKARAVTELKMNGAFQKLSPSSQAFVEFVVEAAVTSSFAAGEKAGREAAVEFIESQELDWDEARNAERVKDWVLEVNWTKVKMAALKADTSV